MVYGYIKQSGGFVQVHSRTGEGTTVSLWLPATSPVIEAADADEFLIASPAMSRGLALLVEDDTQVRQVVRRMLMEFGYSVVEADNADDGMRIVTHTPDIALLMTDIVMPGRLNGRDLADHAKHHHRARSVMLMTGYAPGETGHTDTPTISKPFTKKQLFEFLNRLTT